MMQGRAKKKTSLQKGVDAEEAVCQFLQQRGLRVLERNHRCRFGEIDLIMHDRGHLVFVEVRYRGHGRFGSGAETVSLQKQARIISTATLYLQRIDNPPPCRFDVVSVTGRQEYEIEWIKDAFQQ